MKARLRKLLDDLRETFWLIPGGMVLGGILLAILLVGLDRDGFVPDWLVKGAWVYNGGGGGARTLLGAIASTTIGVAGTVFSITIAALSLAAAQMGPRLLRNFTRDRGNQITLGAFLGTFSYALMVLRSVRTIDEGEFVPHLSLTVGIALAFVCVATLVYFVGHMAGRINVDTVIELVGEDVRLAVQRLTLEQPGQTLPPDEIWRGAKVLSGERRGYVQQLEYEGLADWAAERNTAIRLLVGPGDFLFPGAPIARLLSPVEDTAPAIRNAIALGSKRVPSTDLEFAFRQLVEVAVRALSPGINDPHTAISALDRLGAALCDVAPRHLPSGAVRRQGRCVLVFPSVTYDGLLDACFNMIRQNAATQVAVLMRIVEVLQAVASCERDAERLAGLQRHGDLVLSDAERNLGNPADLADLRRRHSALHATRAASAAEATSSP